MLVCLRLSFLLFSRLALSLSRFSWPLSYLFAEQSETNDWQTRKNERTALALTKSLILISPMTSDILLLLRLTTVTLMNVVIFSRLI